jgi:hypothetical protein
MITAEMKKEVKEINYLLKSSKDYGWQAFKEDRRNLNIPVKRISITANELPSFRNFHIITEHGIIIKRMEVYYPIKNIKQWILRFPDNSTEKYEDFERMINRFVEVHNQIEAEKTGKTLEESLVTA